MTNTEVKERPVNKLREKDAGAYYALQALLAVGTVLPAAVIMGHALQRETTLQLSTSRVSACNDCTV